MNEQKVRIVLVGDSHVGKTSILMSFADNNFPSQHLPTIGVDFRFRRIQVNGQSVKLQIWDTAGQERFNSITSSYYRGSDIVCLVYDISQRTTFQNLEGWYRNAKSMLGNQEVLFMIIGNKSDKRDREVTAEEGAVFAANHSAGFFEVSAKSRANIPEVFSFLAESIVKNSGNSSDDANSNVNNNANSNPITLSPELQQPQPKRWFCSLF